ncbi:MAG: hypothetical protein KF862_26280 [Chitinophagaceae bacterium]|nr:hypothetical protein [Chitinophagaceae bacterium]
MIFRSAGIIIIHILIVQFVKGQSPLQWTALVQKKGKNLVLRENMAEVNDNGFYLYRNCIYDLRLKSGERYQARLADIRPDSLFFLSHVNEAVAQREGVRLDTLALSFTDISKLFLLADRIIGLYSNIDLGRYTISFQQDTAHAAAIIKKVPVFYGDSTLYEIYPYLTKVGIDRVYEKGGKTYYYEGMLPNPNARVYDTVYRKKAVWFIPPFDTNVDEIKGLALGFAALPANDKKTLKVKGLCIEVLTMGYFAPLFGGFLQKDAFVYNKEINPTEVTKKGWNINVSGAVGDEEISGLYTAGITTMVNKLEGFAFTGLNTIAVEMKGVCISGLRNQCKRARGVQIALFNSSKDFKGIQIGLWNKNQKRSLPFINWNFGAR